MLYALVNWEEVRKHNEAALVYLRDLALAGHPFRLIWGGMLLDADSIPPALASLRPYLGPSGDKASAMLYVGGVPGAVARISCPDDCPPRNYALLSWPADTIPAYLVDVLRMYDGIFALYGGAAPFRAAGLEVTELPVPIATGVEMSRAGLSRPPNVRSLLVTVGEWERGVEHVVRSFLTRYKKADGVGLAVSCQQVPGADWLKGAVEGLSKRDLPFLYFHPWPPIEEIPDPEAFDRLLLAGDAVVDYSQRLDLSTVALRALSLGKQVLQPPADLEQYAGGPYWAGCGRRQHWRKLQGIDFDTLVTVERGPWDNTAGDIIAARVVVARRAAEAERTTLVPAAPGSLPVAASAEPSGPVLLGFVVPFMGRDVTGLHRAVDALVADASRTLPQSPVLVSVQGDDQPVQGINVNICVSRPESGPPGAWNLAAARNAGVRWLLEHRPEVTHVAFVDADVTVPAGYVSALSRAAGQRAGAIVVPSVTEPGRPVRIASGMAAVPVEAWKLARGYDEEYYGWGHEDIDFLHRLRDQHRIEIVRLDPSDETTGLHQAHAPQVGKDEDGRRNLARYERMIEVLSQGGAVVVNVGVSSFPIDSPEPGTTGEPGA